MAAGKWDLFKKKPSREESDYRSAKELMEAVSYINRFERKVSALRDAAAIFEKLGDYQDAQEKCRICREEADQAEKTGCQETFARGIDKKEKAGSKSDYIDAMEEFRRLRPYKEYWEKSKREIRECKAGIRKLETIASYKRRGIALLVLVICGIGLTQTPVYPLAKGVVHQMRGEHRAALNCYKEAEFLPGVGKRIRSCYYELAEGYLDQGKEKKAMKAYRLAGNYSDASEKTIDLEKKIIREAGIGEVVPFAGLHWIILDRQGEKVLLIKKELGTSRVFDRKKNAVWKNSDLRTWMNSTFLKMHFTEQEKSVLEEQYTGKAASDKAKAEYVFALSEKEYRKYKELLSGMDRSWWLRDTGLGQDSVKCVDASGQVREAYMADTERYVRPAVWVNHE